MESTSQKQPTIWFPPTYPIEGWANPLPRARRCSTGSTDASGALPFRDHDEAARAARAYGADQIAKRVRRAIREQCDWARISLLCVKPNKVRWVLQSLPHGPSAEVELDLELDVYFDAEPFEGEGDHPDLVVQGKLTWDADVSAPEGIPEICDLVSSTNPVLIDGKRDSDDQLGEKVGRLLRDMEAAINSAIEAVYTLAESPQRCAS